MAKHAGLPWDTVFSAELFHHYKPDREAYLGAVELLSCKPAEVMMVAAHPLDLKAAQSCGLKTGLGAASFGARPRAQRTGGEQRSTSRARAPPRRKNRSISLPATSSNLPQSRAYRSPEHAKAAAKPGTFSWRVLRGSDTSALPHVFSGGCEPSFIPRTSISSAISIVSEVSTAARNTP